MRCYVPPADWSNELITLSQEEAHHAAHVLRAKVGQPVKVFDGCGREGITEIKELKRNRVTLKMVQQSAKPKPRVALTLVQALTREQKLDIILQKATELGATTIVPVLTEHAIARGVFGVPTVAVGGELFWGFDTFPMIQDFLADPALFESPEMRRLAQVAYGIPRRTPQGSGG